MLENLILSAVPNEPVMKKIRKAISDLASGNGFPGMCIKTIRNAQFTYSGYIHIFCFYKDDRELLERMIVMLSDEFASFVLIEQARLAGAIQQKYMQVKSISLGDAWEILLKEICIVASEVYKEVGLPEGAAGYANRNTMTLGASPNIDDERFRLILSQNELQLLLRLSHWERTVAIRQHFSKHIKAIMHAVEGRKSKGDSNN